MRAYDSLTYTAEFYMKHKYLDSYYGIPLLLIKSGCIGTKFTPHPKCSKNNTGEKQNLNELFYCNIFRIFIVVFTIQRGI